MPPPGPIGDPIRLTVELVAHALAVGASSSRSTWWWIEVGVELRGSVTECLFRVKRLKAVPLCDRVTEQASHCHQPTGGSKCVGVVYALQHSITAYHTSCFYFVFCSVWVEFHLEEQETVVQVLSRGYDFESPDVTIVEAVVLGGDRFEDVLVPLVLLEFVELSLGGDDRVTLRGKGFATQITTVRMERVWLRFLGKLSVYGLSVYLQLYPERVLGRERVELRHRGDVSAHVVCNVFGTSGAWMNVFLVRRCRRSRSRSMKCMHAMSSEVALANRVFDVSKLGYVQCARMVSNWCFECILNGFVV